MLFSEIEEKSDKCINYKKNCVFWVCFFEEINRIHHIWDWLNHKTSKTVMLVALG